LGRPYPWNGEAVAGSSETDVAKSVKGGPKDQHLGCQPVCVTKPLLTLEVDCAYPNVLVPLDVESVTETTDFVSISGVPSRVVQMLETTGCQGEPCKARQTTSPLRYRDVWGCRIVNGILDACVLRSGRYGKWI